MQRTGFFSKALSHDKISVPPDIPLDFSGTAIIADRADGPSWVSAGLDPERTRTTMPEIRVPATGLKSTRDWSMKVDDSVSSMTVLCGDLMGNSQFCRQTKTLSD